MTTEFAIFLCYDLNGHSLNQLQAVSTLGDSTDTIDNSIIRLNTLRLDTFGSRTEQHVKVFRRISTLLCTATSQLRTNFGCVGISEAPLRIP
jgi:hypothetical protein